MLASIERFAVVLRRAGLRVSSAEVIDAARASVAVGLADPRRLHAALRCTMVKRAGDVRVFDELFELYFRRGGELVDATRPDSLLAALRAAGARAGLVDFVAERLRDAAPELGAIERMLLGISDAEVAALIRAAGLAAQLGAMETPLQVGFYSVRIQRQLGVDAAEDAVRGLVSAAVSAGGGQGGVAEAALEATRRNAARLRQAIRDFIGREFARHNARYRERVARSALVDRPLSSLSPAEVRAMRAEVERLARALRARLRQRSHRRPIGRLDLSATLRRSLATDGVPVELRMHRRRPHRPRLVVLCDVSDSVRHVSDFMLHFVYTLVDCFHRVSAFAFVAELGEVSELFRDHDIDRAIELVHSGSAVNVFANSDYGRVLDGFATRHMGRVTSRTTVLVIGDGRSNYHPPRAAVLADIRRRARQVIWLCPEGRAAWGFGDSAMLDYEPHCDRIVVARDLHSLRLVVDQLVVAGR